MATTTDSTQVRERHESLYFVDGNIVILAPCKDESGLLFRVHKSVLSSHSTVFSDMFDVCSPSGCTSENDAEHTYDGVPLIHLSDDADHLGSVLKILYYQSDLPWIPRSPNYPVLIMPILDLSRKYAIDRMYAQIMRHLESDWPQTLRDWDNLERDISHQDVGCIDDQFPEPAAAIKLSRQFDIPSILPAAFYHLSRISILDDWDKIHADPPTALRNPTSRTARWELLSAQDFRCLLLGKAKLTEFLRGRDATDLCHLTDSRRQLYCEVATQQWKRIVDCCLQSANPLAVLKSSMEGQTIAGCSTCTNILMAKIPVVRTEIWEKLGDFFHLKDK